MAEKDKPEPGYNSPDRDVPLHGIEKKGDRVCHHDSCAADRCRLDDAHDALNSIMQRIGDLEDRRGRRGGINRR